MYTNVRALNRKSNKKRLCNDYQCYVSSGIKSMALFFVSSTILA